MTTQNADEKRAELFQRFLAAINDSRAAYGLEPYESLETIPPDDAGWIKAALVVAHAKESDPIAKLFIGG